MLIVNVTHIQILRWKMLCFLFHFYLHLFSSEFRHFLCLWIRRNMLSFSSATLHTPYIDYRIWVWLRTEYTRERLLNNNHWQQSTNDNNTTRICMKYKYKKIIIFETKWTKLFDAEHNISFTWNEIIGPGCRGVFKACAHIRTSETKKGFISICNML